METIRKLIAADKLEKAIDELIGRVRGKDEKLEIQFIEHQATLTKNIKESRRGLITSEQENQTRTRVRYAVLEMLGEIQEIVKSEDTLSETAEHTKMSSGKAKSSPKVFISYNHGDSEVAEKLKKSLEESAIDVLIDRETIQASENISDFIDRSIRETDVTLSVISNSSLHSTWVAMETINTFYHEKFRSDKKFIACYINDDFMQTNFRLKATKQIDARIAEIDQQLPKYIELKIDTIDLNNEKSRLHKLRSNLGDFLLRFRESFTLDIREDKFHDSVAKIINTIKKTT